MKFEIRKLEDSTEYLVIPVGKFFVACFFTETGALALRKDAIGIVELTDVGIIDNQHYSIYDYLLADLNEIELHLNQYPYRYSWIKPTESITVGIHWFHYFINFVDMLSEIRNH